MGTLSDQNALNVGISPSGLHEGGGGGTPGGADTQVQFNDLGAFGGSEGITYDKVLQILTLKAIPGVDAQGLISFSDSDNGARGSLYVDESPYIQLTLSGTNRQVQITASATESSVSVQNGDTGTSVLLDGAKSLLKLPPIADPPSPASEGMIYADTDHHLYYYNGTTWKQLDN